jgi:uncharacterized protein
MGTRPMIQSIEWFSISDIGRIETVDYVLFHAKSVEPFAPCVDGLFAAYAAYLAIPHAMFTPCVYGVKNAPKMDLSMGDRIYLLDISYPAHILEKWADTGAEITIIDHHKTALEDLSGLSGRVLKTFDMDQSGAVLAWRHFHPNVPVPKLYQYVQDRDLWTKRLPYCDLVSLGLSEYFDLFEKTFLQCFQIIQDHGISKNSDLFYMMVGTTVEKEVKEAIEDACNRAKIRLVCGHKVAYTICLTQRERRSYSDIGSALLDKFPNVAFSCTQTGRGWALRSKDDRLDVSIVAKMLGGGGHRNASGCAAELPYWIAKILHRFSK